MDFNIKQIQFWGAIVSLTLILFLMVNFMWPDEDYRTRTIDGDGRGYYAYLPTLVLNHTVDFKKAFEYEKANQPLEYQGHNYHKINDAYINKFPVGTALMMLPFFLIAQILSPWMGFEADGYSLLFQYEVALAALWWLWFGVFFLRKLLKSFKVPDSVILWTIIILITGTNLFHYAFVDVAFSHIYSFAVITAFLYYSSKLISLFKVKYLAISAFLLGWIMLIRPVNVLIILAMPFLTLDSNKLITKSTEIFGSIRNWVVILAFFILGVLPQIIINYLQTGSLVLYGYKGEGFYFLHPHFTDFLFSYKKGWFVYTPIALLLIPAMVNLLRKSKYQFFCFLSFLVLLFYFFSSWWNWYYGDGFGMRPMVEYYSLFALVTALWIKELKPRFKRVFLTISVILVALNMVQSYQYFKGIIHVDSMTRAAYWHQFLKVSDDYRNMVAPAAEYYYGKLSEYPLISSTNDFENNQTGWSSLKNLSTSRYQSPDHSQKFNQKTEFSSSFIFTAGEHTSNKQLYLILNAQCFEPKVNSALQSLFVIDIRNPEDQLIFYKAFALKRLPNDVTNQWFFAHTGILIPKLSNSNVTKVYIWNKSKTTFFIDDFEVKLYEIH